MFGLPGWLEFAVIGIVVLLIFGKRLPGVMRGLGQGIVEFRRATSETSSGYADRQVESGGRDRVAGETVEAEPRDARSAL